MKKVGKKDVAFCAIRHLEKYYNIILNILNEEKFFELKHDVGDLKKANKQLWKCLNETK